MTVYLVGAGPGDPELLTLKAAKLLAEAEVVLHDRLVSKEILDICAPWAEFIDVGKDPSGRSVSQKRIQQSLIEKGLRHQIVVRLKGGDPFVFGRGAEEVASLAAHGIAVEVVPGVTSAIAGPAAAGIPVTYRNVASAFTVVTAHQDPNSDEFLNWEALADLRTTLVILMGAKRAKHIKDRLINAGMASSTPVAVISSATTSSQTVARFHLSNLGEETIQNPAVIVVGEVVNVGINPQVLNEISQTQGVASWL